MLSDAAPEGSVDDAESLARALEVLSATIRGRYRLATEREYDYALAHGAIEPENFEHGLVQWFTDEEPRDGLLLPPDRSPEGFWSGIVHYRIVWEPDD
jgi:hypothetical protein